MSIDITIPWLLLLSAVAESGHHKALYKVVYIPHVVHHKHIYQHVHSHHHHHKHKNIAIHHVKDYGYGFKGKLTAGIKGQPGGLHIVQYPEHGYSNGPEYDTPSYDTDTHHYGHHTYKPEVTLHSDIKGHGYKIGPSYENVPIKTYGGEPVYSYKPKPAYEYPKVQVGYPKGYGDGLVTTYKTTVSSTSPYDVTHDKGAPVYEHVPSEGYDKEPDGHELAYYVPNQGHEYGKPSVEYPKDGYGSPYSPYATEHSHADPGNDATNYGYSTLVRYPAITYDSLEKPHDSGYKKRHSGSGAKSTNSKRNLTENTSYVKRNITVQYTRPYGNYSTNVYNGHQNYTSLYVGRNNDYTDKYNPPLKAR